MNFNKIVNSITESISKLLDYNKRELKVGDSITFIPKNDTFSEGLSLGIIKGVYNGNLIVQTEDLGRKTYYEVQPGNTMYYDEDGDYVGVIDDLDEDETEEFPVTPEVKKNHPWFKANQIKQHISKDTRTSFDDLIDAIV
jgi:hypothetical protein